MHEGNLCLMDIEIKWLRDFVTLVSTNNFSRAAELRHVTQPAFSRRIQQLEQYLGCKLINRRSQPFKLTHQGETFHQSAMNILNELDQVRLLLNPAQKSKVTFAATHTLSLGVFPTLAQLISSSPSPVNTQLKVADADDCIQYLNDNECDFLLAFSDSLLEAHQFESLSLGNVNLVPVCKPNGDGNAIYNLDTKDDLPYLGYQQNIYLGRMVNKLLSHSSRKNMKASMEAPMADSLKMMAMKGLGVAWIPAFSVEQELTNNSLALAGGTKWMTELEVRVYATKQTKQQHDMLWNLLSHHKLPKYKLTNA